MLDVGRGVEFAKLVNGTGEEADVGLGVGYLLLLVRFRLNGGFGISSL